MSLPTVTQHLTTLLSEQLIEKCGQLASSVGRKAAAYRIVETARIAIGIEILPKKIYIVALNLHGKKEAKESFTLNFEPQPSYFEKLKEIVAAFLQANGYEKSQILGIGLGIQGLTSPDGKTVTYGQILNCTGLSIEMFSKYFSVPCRFVHDSECASNSELWENPEIKDAVYLSLGHHLGGAIIINGELQRGLTGKSGTFEHMTLVPNGLSCYCGKKGCAECYCSGTSLLENDMELEEFFSNKEKGDESRIKKWKVFLDYLSTLINNLHMVLEIPVILGGNITPYFTTEDISYIQKKVYELSTFPYYCSWIISGHCRNDAVSIGAALPYIREFLDGIAIQEAEQ